MGGFFLAGLVLCSVGISLAAAAQQPTDPATAERLQAPDAPSGSKDRHLVRLTVVVTDKSGEAVTGLQRQDFTVYDNDQPSKVLSFHALCEATPPSYTDARAVHVALSSQVISGRNTMVRSTDRCCTVDFCAVYFLSIEAAPSDHPGEYHSLAVKVDLPNLRVQARMGYYAQP